MNEVILINYTGKSGGGAQCAYEITKALLNKGERIIAIVSDKNENIDFWGKLDLVKLIKIETYENNKQFLINTLLWNKKYKKKIIEETKEYKIKAIYCPMCTFWTRKINEIFKESKTIVVNHDPILHSGDKYKWLYKIFKIEKNYRNADYIVVHSKKFISTVEKKYKKEGKVKYIPHGPLNIYNTISNKKISNKYDRNKINYLFFGTISKYKGIEVLADAYKIVSKKNENVTLTIAGAGDFSKYKHKFSGIKNLNVVNRWIENEEVESFFKGPNVIAILPYIDATQSGVIPVAMRNRVPVIATNIGGISEQIQDGKTGILVEVGNANKLAEAMIELGNNKEKISEINSNVERYLDKTSWDMSAKILGEVIHE